MLSGKVALFVTINELPENIFILFRSFCAQFDFEASSQFYKADFPGDETTFEVQTEDVHSFGFMISWVAFNITDMDHRKFLGYQVKDLSIFREYPVLVNHCSF